MSTDFSNNANYAMLNMCVRVRLHLLQYPRADSTGSMDATSMQHASLHSPPHPAVLSACVAQLLVHVRAYVI